MIIKGKLFFSFFPSNSLIDQSGKLVGGLLLNKRLPFWLYNPARKDTVHP